MSRVSEVNTLLGTLLGDKKSHPEKLLIDHLRNVSSFAKRLSGKQGLNTDEELLDAITLTHDMGKVHPKFQKLLEGKGQGVNHSKPSAWFTYSLTENIWAAELVCRHHTHLRNIEDMIADWLGDCDSSDVVNKLLPEWPYKLGEDVLFILSDYLYGEARDKMSIEDWLTARTHYSLLVAADRMEAIGIESLPDEDLPSFTHPTLPHRSVEVDTWRENVKNACLENAGNISKPGVYTLTLPTGAGKTLTGLEIAYNWAKSLGCKTIIYGLPFISIVEQTASIAKTVFGNNAVQEDHSLAYGKDNEENDYTNTAWDKMSTLFRYWRDPVVLTTLVQFWDALFNPKANCTMNFHRLSNAVVILDEPQTISPRYWQEFGRLLAFLSQKWNTVFLLMTATQPHIIATQEIAPAHVSFPYVRHQYQALMERKYKMEELAEILEENLPIHESSGLVVMNRKKAALDAYQVLEKLEVDGPIVLLSGWVTPWRRRVILRYLKWLEKKNIRRYLVATQVVEAGVDLDFGWVFRDLGPMDSIIQVGGRCNRHARKDFIGKVLVAEMTNDNGQPLWRRVYDDILIEKTREVLEKQTTFSEDNVRFVVDEYYRKILEGLKSTPIFEDLAKGQWGEFPKLIDENNNNNVTVFVEENKQLLPMLKELQEKEWTLENRDEQKRLLQKVQQYAIEIPKDMISDCRKYCAGISVDSDEPVFRPILGGRAWFLGKEAIKRDNGLYNKIKGFVPPAGDWENIY